MKTYLYRASNLKSTITFLAFNSCGSQFLAPVKKSQFLRFIHLIRSHQLNFLFLITLSAYFNACARNTNTNTKLT